MKKTNMKLWVYLILIFLLPGMLTIPVSAVDEVSGDPVWTEWPGGQEICQYDGSPAGLSNASGLDFYNGRLFAVDNGTGRLWVMEAFPNGTVRMAQGFETGKRVRFADRISAAGPDAEGITVTDAGDVFLASERDNEKPWESRNAVLQVDPWDDGDVLQVMQQWDVTAILPKCAINQGIEAIEWVSGEDLKDQLPDQNTHGLYRPENYPQAVAVGVFFLALEMNDHIYACVLNQDGTAVLLAEIDPGLTGIAALDYDAATGTLWAASDDRGENCLAKLRFSEGGLITEYVLPPEGLDPDHNHEGFAIAEESFTVNDSRCVYWLRDGAFSETLRVGSLDHHVHRFSEELVYDEQNHWQACVCGERSSTEEHRFGNVVTAAARKEEASRTHTAEYYRSCLICGAVDQSETFFLGQPMDPERLTTPVAVRIYGIPQM